MKAAALIVAVVASGIWFWFLALGRARGSPKRLALRATLLGFIAAMWAMASNRGLLARASPGFHIALLLALLVVAVGYLYLIRFCDVCGRMVRDLRPSACPRCGAPLPRHGMTARLRSIGPAPSQPRGRRGG